MTKKTTLWQRLKNAFSPANTPKNNDNPAFSQADVNNSTGQMIVDLTQEAATKTTAPPADSTVAIETITADDIDVMLASMGYQFSYHPPKILANAENINADERPIHHFTMQISDGERDWGCLVRFFAHEQLLVVYSIFPFSVPDTHRGEMLAVLAYLNYDLVLGNLELDVYDGELRFKTSLDLEVTGLSEGVMAYLLQSNFSVTSHLHDTLAEVVAKPNPASTASEAVDNLLSAQQEKTFYLMTDLLQ